MFEPQAVPVWAQLTGPALPEALLFPEQIAAWCKRSITDPGFPKWTPEFLSDRRERFLKVENPSPAAVLMAICPEAAELILTRRPLHLKDHPGQISFPGGRREPSDPSAIDAACREAEEEIGLTRERITPLITLPDYMTVTGFQVTPVLGIVSPGYALKPHPDEVEEILKVPMSFLMNPSNHQVRRVQLESGLVEFFAIPYGRYFVWGATAAIIRNLYHFLYAAWNQSRLNTSDSP